MQLKSIKFPGQRLATAGHGRLHIPQKRQRGGALAHVHLTDKAEVDELWGIGYGWRLSIGVVTCTVLYIYSDHPGLTTQTGIRSDPDPDGSVGDSNIRIKVIFRRTQLHVIILEKGK